jgi:hypothetical protein
MLKETAEVVVALNLTPDQLNEQIKRADALIVRSATKVRDSGGKGGGGIAHPAGRARARRPPGVPRRRPPAQAPPSRLPTRTRCRESGGHPRPALRY